MSELSQDGAHDVDDVGADDARATAGIRPPGQRPPPELESVPKPPAHPGLLVALLAIAVVAVGVVVIVFTAQPACAVGPGCATAGRLPVASASPSISATPSYGPSATVALARTMPDDLRLADCTTTRDAGVPLADVVSYFECTEAAGSQLPGLRVWGYQFRDARSYSVGVRAFNDYAKYDANHVVGDCPPARDTGYRWWSRDGERRGQLECYADPSAQPNYVWTDDATYTLIVAAAPAAATFEELDAWWRSHNRSGSVR